MTGAVSARHKLSLLGVHSPPCWDVAELSLFTTSNFKLRLFSESSSSGSLAPITWRNACVLFSFLWGTWTQSLRDYQHSCTQAYSSTALSRAIPIVYKLCYRLSSHKCHGFMYDFKSKHFFLGTGICPCTKNRNNFSLLFAIICNISVLVWQSLELSAFYVMQFPSLSIIHHLP